MSKKPFVSVDALEAITKTYPTPFHLYNKAEIVRRAKLLQEAFSWNAGFKEYFAVKATPNPYIVRLLAELGCGCDCANATELTLAKACGVTGQNIMLSSNDTTVLDFARANELGAIINLDAGGDMLTTLEEAVGSNMPQVMCARLNPGGVFESQNGIIGNPDDAKFGMTEEQLFQTFAYLKTKGVTEFGLHAFLASNAQEEDYYPNLARVLFKLAVKLHTELDIHIGFIDLSGGIGVAYEPSQIEPDVLAIGQGVKRAFEEVLVPAGMGDVAIYTELGRWLLGPAGALVTRVLHQKETYRHYLGVDACAANLMRPAIYDAYHHITVMGKEDAPATHTYNVVGGLCENNDQFAKNRQLPEAAVGDLLFIHDTGAHGFSMGYNYNGRLRSAELLLLEDGSVQLIRRAETEADYFATLAFDGSDFSDLAQQTTTNTTRQRARKTMDMKNLTGAITALVTPFDAQGNVDFEALERFVDFQIEQGIDGILALGTTGESSTMTDEEDIEVVKAILARAQGKVPVIGGAGSNSSAESLRKAEALEKAGVDGLLLITPYYNKSNEEGIYQHFSYVLDRVDVPCILYNIPGRTGCSISERNVQRLAAHPNAWGIKEASGDIAYATKVARYLSDDFTMWSGNDDMIVPLLSLGASGVISVWSNLDPKMVHDLVTAWHRGEVSLARELQLQYLDLVHALFCEVNPIPVKAALARMGFMEENYRLPLWKMTEEHADVLENAMRKAGLLDA